MAIETVFMQWAPPLAAVTVPPENNIPVRRNWAEGFAISRWRRDGNGKSVGPDSHAQHGHSGRYQSGSVGSLKGGAHLAHAPISVRVQRGGLYKGALVGVTQHHATQTFHDAVVQAQMLVDDDGIAQQ